MYLSLSHTVSWVRCGTSLYWFLIFVFFPTLSCTGLSACLVINPIICYSFSFPFVCTTVGQRQHWHYKYLSWVWGWDKKSIQRITIWHHEACWVMTNGDHEWHIFYHPYTDNEFFFLLTTKYLIYIGKKHELDFQGILNTLRCDMVTSFQHFHDVTDGRAAVLFLSSHKAGTRMWDRNISHGLKQWKSWSGVREKKILHCVIAWCLSISGSSEAQLRVFFSSANL